MSYKVTPPNLKNSKSYELFRKEHDVWETTAPVLEEKRGAASAVLLPKNYSSKDLKEKSYETLSVQTSDGGFKLVKEFLEKKLKEDDLEMQVLTWDKDCIGRDRDIEDFREFLSVYDRVYKKKAVEASSELIFLTTVRAFMVLKSPDITETQIIEFNLRKPDEMFENICIKLKIVPGRVPWG